MPKVAEITPSSLIHLSTELNRSGALNPTLLYLQAIANKVDNVIQKKFKENSDKIEKEAKKQRRIVECLTLVNQQREIEKKEDEKTTWQKIKDFIKDKIPFIPKSKEEEENSLSTNEDFLSLVRKLKKSGVEINPGDSPETIKETLQVHSKQSTNENEKLMREVHTLSEQQTEFMRLGKAALSSYDSQKYKNQGG